MLWGCFSSARILKQSRVGGEMEGNKHTAIMEENLDVRLGRSPCSRSMTLSVQPDLLRNGLDQSIFMR